MTVTMADVDRVLAQLRSPTLDNAFREQLHNQVRNWGREPLSADVAERLLHAATEVYPAMEHWPHTHNNDLVMALCHSTQFDPAVVLEVYPRLGPDCRESALHLLARLPTLQASSALARLLLDGCENGDLPLPPQRWHEVLAPLATAPRHPGILVGPLIRCLAHPNIWAMYAALPLLSYVGRRLLPVEDRRLASQALSARLPDLLSRLRQLSPESVEYQRERPGVELLLNLLSRLAVADDSQVRKIFEDAARQQDPQIALWGGVGLIPYRSPLVESTLARVAADARTRAVLYHQLTRRGLLGHYPAAYRTQSALAASEMVEWLMVPSELGRTPDEIEEVAVLPLQTGEGLADLYMFRFRTFKPDGSAGGWQVGSAGPYLRSQQPTTRSLGATFSRFELLESKPIEEHAAAILETLRGWGVDLKQTP
jgi:hypothetical protein